VIFTFACERSWRINVNIQTIGIRTSHEDIHKFGTWPPSCALSCPLLSSEGSFGGNSLVGLQPIPDYRGH